MSGIIVPSGPSVQPVFTGYTPVGKPSSRPKSAIDPDHRIVQTPVQAAPAVHAQKGSHRRALTITFVAAMVVGFVLMALQLGLSAAYDGRFLPGVSVAGQQVGGLTRPQAQQLLEARALSTRVRFTAGTTAYTLTPAEVGASFDAATTLDQAYAVGRQTGLIAMPAALWQGLRHGSVGMSYTTDQPTYQAFIQKVVAASGQTPVDASIVITNGVPAAQSAVSGHDLGTAAVADAITTQLSHPGTAAPTLHPSVQPARIQAVNLSSAITQTQQLLATPIAITYQGKSFQPTAAQIGTWIIYDKSPPNKAPGLTPKLSPDAITAYLNGIARQINVSPVVQKINVQNGVANVFQQGQNGLVLDTAALSAKIAALTPGQPFTMEVPTTPVPFQTQYNNSVALPYDQYIEVNLSTQHLWVYQNHTVVFDSPVTSGATGAGFPTATGMFSILSKQTDRHLVGYQYGPAYNYDVFVQYWMQFYEGYGLHDASWRNGNFGGQDYYYGGSHGCVNLPLATAAWLYNWSSIGTPVWVHT